MSTKSLANPGQRCKLILQHCLAIQLCKPGHTPQDFWMYDSGYIVFQNFLAANEQCWWNAPLTAATRALKYAGHVAPGMLLVTADPCALEILRGAYARSVLKPPATYVISSLGDIDDCIVTPTLQGQFTPLPEAICNVIMDLTSEGQSATIENVRKKLATRFPHMSLPAIEIIYDTLAQLMQEQKIYQTSKGYFIFTPEKRRSRSRTRNINATYCDLTDCNDLRADMMIPTTATNTTAVATSSNTPTSLLLSSSSSSSYTRNIGAKRPILMTNVDAVRSMYGEISTERDGDLTHQCIQTNLTDVICGGNPNDKILYARVGKRRSASFPTPRSLERRHSLRLFGSSSKRLQRFSSTRSLSKTYVQSMTTDSSSSEFQSTDSSTRKKGSLLSRLFRRRTRPKHERLETFSAQFPPVEWFNSRTVHLHSVGTQTSDIDIPLTHTYSNSTFYTGSEVMSQRSASSTLPRRRQRHHLSSESTFLLSSRDCSPIRRRSPATFSSNSLPHHPMSKNNNNNNNHNSNVDTTNDNNNVKKNINSMTVTRNSNKVDGQNESKTANVQQITDFDCDETFFECRKKGSAHASSLDIQCATPVRSYLRSSLPIRHSAALRQAVNTERNESPSPSPSLSPSHGMSNTSSRHSSSTTVTGGGSQTPALRRSWRTQQMKRDGINLRESSAITLQVTSSAVEPPITTTICTPSPTTTTEWHVGNGNGAYNVKGPHNTKIYVQNTPLRNVITFENEQLLANSNVYIINNETLTNSTGDVLNKTLTTQMHKKQQPSKPQQKPTEVEEEAKASAISNENNLAKNSTTKVSPEEANMVVMVDEKPTQDDEYFENKSIEEFHKISFNLQPQQQQQQQPVHHNKIVDNSDENNDDDNNDDDDDSYNVTTNHVVVKRAKSISYNNNNNYNNNNSNINHKTNNNNNNNNNKNNNITTLNNNRRLSMPQQSTLNAIGHYGSTHLIYKNNVRKNNDNNNINNHNNNNNNNQQQEQQFADFYVDNLGYYEKNNYKMLSNNALCEAKNLRNSNQYIYNNHHQQPQHINSNNNHNNTIFNNCHSSSNSMNAIGGIGGNSGGNNLAQLLLHKHMMESEPNLITLNETNNYFFSANPNANTNQLLTNKSSSTTTTTTTATKDKIDNYSSVGTLTTLNDENRMSFPTLHDISFNFTSLAAQRILQAVSLNSIDTLVELNLDAAKKFNKQQVNQHQHQQQQQQQHDNELNNPTTKNTQKTAAIATTTTKITAPQPALCTTDYGLV